MATRTSPRYFLKINGKYICNLSHVLNKNRKCKTSFYCYDRLLRHFHIYHEKPSLKHFGCKSCERIFPNFCRAIYHYLFHFHMLFYKHDKNQACFGCKDTLIQYVKEITVAPCEKDLINFGMSI